MQPFKGDLHRFGRHLKRSQALLPAPSEVEIDITLRWESGLEAQFIEELDHDLLKYFGVEPLKIKEGYYLIVIEQDTPFALAIMQENAIALSSRFIDLINFMSVHIFLQRQITQYKRNTLSESKSVILKEIDTINEQMPLYYTAISSASSEGRISSKKFKRFLSDLISISMSDEVFRMARAWMGFTLLHEVGHYVYSQNNKLNQIASKDEEFFCDRFALKEMIPNVSHNNEQAIDLYKKFVDFIGCLLIFFTNRWLSDYATDNTVTHPATFERTAHIIDIVNTDGAWTDLRNSLHVHWASVQNVMALETQRKLITSAGLHEAISEKLEFYLKSYHQLFRMIN